MSQTTRLDELTQSYLDLRWNLDPVAASEAGLPQFDGYLGSFTDEGVRAHTVALRSIIHAAEEAEVDGLQDEIDRTALLNEMRFTARRFSDEQPHVRNPGFWLAHLFEGLYLPLAQRDRTPADRARAAAARLRAVPRYLDDARATLAACPTVFLELGRAVIAAGTTLVDELERHLVPDDDATYPKACGEARDALEAFGAHLGGDLAERATDDFAIGVDAFNFRLQFQHALQSTAPELARYGMRLVSEVEDDLERLAAELAPGTPWPDLMDRLRDEYPSADSLVGTYATEMDRARRFVDERGLAPLPEGELAVMATPSFLQPLVPFAAYQPPGAFSADRTGSFYVSPPGAGDTVTERDALRDHCIHEIPSTALHEGYPGHHLQFLVAQAQPRLVRRVLATPVTVEGWALYCEEMMGEEGFYRSIEERFFQRVALLWRALRIVLDVGLHTNGLTVTAAVDQLVDRVHFSRSHAEAEVRRYCAEPAYQLAYAVGRREIRALRDDVRNAAGADFSLRGFHDDLLAYGGLPVSLARWGMLGGGDKTVPDGRGR